LSKKWISNENIEKLKTSLLNNNLIKNVNQKKINDNEIMSLNNDLKKWKLNVSDLLG